jgi:PPOX class probable F420-dependent enzyme
MASYFTHLEKAQFMSLTTYKKSGEGVATPVWFVDIAGKLYVITNHDAWKLKRLRNTGKATVAPCTASGKVTGDSHEAKGYVVADEAEGKTAHEALTKKYGIQFRLFDLMGRIQNAKRSYLAITAP